MPLTTPRTSIIALGIVLCSALSCMKGGNAGPCGSGEMECNSVCMDVRSDIANCGACGYACANNNTCRNAMCVCAPGFVNCGNACVSSNTEHCGTSCTACGAGSVCNDGMCSSSCPSGSTMCSDGACSSNTDSAHCGSGCAACGGGQTCSGGACIGGGPGTGGSSGTGGSGTGAGGTGGSPADGGTGGAMVFQQRLITSAPNAYWNTNGQLTTVTTGNIDVTVNDTTMAQTWEGFGGAFNEMGWSYLSMLSTTERDRAIRLLFDATDGAHFVMGRIPIGASDYALMRYTEDETPNDTALTNFSIARDMMYLIPYVKAAQMVNSSIRWWASPWTPPTWMKTNTGTVNGISCARVGGTAFDGGCMQDIPANLTALAQYFVRWIQAYQQQGIPIEILAPQNEPNYAQGYPSAIWAPALYTKFVVQNLAPELTRAQLSTKIMLGTMSNGDNGMQSKDLMVVTNVMGDATARTLVKMVGLQWGMLDIFKANPSWLGIGSLPVWATEHKAGNYPWNPPGSPAYREPAPNDQAYGVESWGFIRDAIRGGVTSYSAWNMVLDTVGKGNDTARQWSQDSLLVVNTASRTLTLSPAYYVFRHISQYVQVGARVVTTTGGDAIAFKNPDGSVVVVMYNSGGTRTAIVSVLGKRLQFGMPGTGWATIVTK